MWGFELNEGDKTWKLVSLKKKQEKAWRVGANEIDEQRAKKTCPFTPKLDPPPPKP
jgi:hypothetical protein